MSAPAVLACWPEGIHGLSTADAVVEGRVVAIRSFQDADTILSEATLAVLAVLSGDVFSDRVTVRYAGGVVDDLGLMVSGEPEFQVGEEVRVDLLREPDGAYRVDGGNAGKVTLGGIGPLYGYGGTTGPTPICPSDTTSPRRVRPIVPASTRPFRPLCRPGRM